MKTEDLINSEYKNPFIEAPGDVNDNWNKIVEVCLSEKNKTIVIDCYQGVDIDEIEDAFDKRALFVRTEDFFKPEEQIRALTLPDVTEDEIFGYLTRLRMVDFFDKKKINDFKKSLEFNQNTLVLCGSGASLFVEDPDVMIYADMARWEIQKRMSEGSVNGLGVKNNNDPFNHQYKRGYFVDWRVCDKHKKEWFLKADYFLDTNKRNSPKLISLGTLTQAFKQAVQQPFKIVPFYVPGPWGGHWMEKVFGLDDSKAPNHAWCFNCIPEENSILFKIGDNFVEVPSINLVFFESISLLGEAVEARFGKEFPIRFDFLDTMGGGNLSLQVHPDTTYIQENFGMHYTQDESYYILDAGEDAMVYLGLKEEADVEQMFDELNDAQVNNSDFNAESYINKLPAKKHDHFLIPAGTVHCSGKDSMVLEISATPYIFTFKMWDWGRLGLDGKPRPINIEHAKNVLRSERRTQFVNEELVNNVEIVEKGEGWVEEKTGLHQREFIETRRHYFSKTVLHKSNGSVNVMMLIEGEEAVVESPDSSFEPYVVRYAEAFIIPASVKSFTISPSGISKGKTIATIKAYVRT